MMAGLRSLCLALNSVSSALTHPESYYCLKLPRVAQLWANLQRLLEGTRGLAHSDSALQQRGMKGIIGSEIKVSFQNGKKARTIDRVSENCPKFCHPLLRLLGLPRAFPPSNQATDLTDIRFLSPSTASTHYSKSHVPRHQHCNGKIRFSASRIPSFDKESETSWAPAPSGSRPEWRRKGLLLRPS